MTINASNFEVKTKLLRQNGLEIVNLDQKMAAEEVTCHLSVKIKNFMTINASNFDVKTKLRHTGIDQKMATIKMVKNDQNFRFPTQSPIL